MPTGKLLNVAALASVTLLIAPTPAAWGTVNIPTSPVPNPGNASENTINGPFGSVAYSYRVGTTEVTNAQYAAFLEAVADADPNSLFNSSMQIVRAGVSGSYSYTAAPAFASHPVNYVSFWDTARFANWLHNGQPTGPQNNSTTEDGAYTLTAAGIANNTVTRNSGWQWAVTSSNEWYKAAYHQPAAQGGDIDDYWLYPTSSNTAPNAFEANYLYSPPLPLPLGDTMPVASFAANFYGAHDMAGNVYEWSETILSGPPFNAHGYMWGGAFDNVAGWLTNANAYSPPAFDERAQVGFRVVTLIPGPSSIALAGVCGLFVARRRR